MFNFSILNVISFLGRQISAIIAAWPLFVLAALLISPIGPHLRWSYTKSAYSYHQCTYLGSRGFIDPDLTPDCPIVVILDSRNWRRG